MAELQGTHTGRPCDSWFGGNVHIGDPKASISVGPRLPTTRTFTCLRGLAYNDSRASPLCPVRAVTTPALRVPLGCRLRTYASGCHQAGCLYLRNADPSLLDGLNSGEPAVTPAGVAAVQFDVGIVHVVFRQSAGPQPHSLLRGSSGGSGSSFRILPHRFHRGVYRGRAPAGSRARRILRALRSDSALAAAAGGVFLSSRDFLPLDGRPVAESPRRGTPGGAWPSDAPAGSMGRSRPARRRGCQRVHECAPSRC